MIKGRKYELDKSSCLKAIHSPQHLGCVHAHRCWIIEDKADSMSWIDDKGGTRLERKSFSSTIGVETFSVLLIQAKHCYRTPSNPISSGKDIWRLHMVLTWDNSIFSSIFVVDDRELHAEGTDLVHILYPIVVGTIISTSLIRWRIVGSHAMSLTPRLAISTWTWANITNSVVATGVKSKRYV